MKITIIGAGSIVFTKNLIGDILSVKELSDARIALVDIDAKRLKNVVKMVDTMIELLNCNACVEASTNYKEVISGSDFVITTIQVGGLKAYETDLMLPLKKYGLNQCVGDTIGPGGVFRALRTIPILVDICKDMEELCPDAYLLNYVNPMSMNMLGLFRISGIKMIGLCHSVQGTNEDLAKYIGAPIDEISYEVAGINHMAWFLKYIWKGRDAYPLIRAAANNLEYYNGDLVKFEILNHFGYFVTESGYHFSEYVPYFRQYPEILKKINQMTWLGLDKYGGSCFEYVKDRQESFYANLQKQVDKEIPMEISRTHEYCSYIIEAITCGRLCKIYGNVRNSGLITNLIDGCCVEVPVLVDKNGFTPCYIGELPAQLAALNRTHVSVHDLAVTAALTGDKEAAIHALMLDPLTASVLPLTQIKSMAVDLFEAEKEYLPQFSSLYD